MNDTEHNKWVVRDFVRTVWADGDVAALGRCWTEDSVNHSNAGPSPPRTGRPPRLPRPVHGGVRRVFRYPRGNRAAGCGGEHRRDAGHDSRRAHGLRVSMGSICIDRSRRGWDNPTMVITLDAKRRLTVPAALAPAKPGDYFDARFDAEEDALVFRRLAGRENWLEVLKACPVSPDDVPRRRRAPARRRKL